MTERLNGHSEGNKGEAYVTIRTFSDPTARRDLAAEIAIKNAAAPKQSKLTKEQAIANFVIERVSLISQRQSGYMSKKTFKERLRKLGETYSEARIVLRKRRG